MCAAVEGAASIHSDAPDCVPSVSNVYSSGFSLQYLVVLCVCVFFFFFFILTILVAMETFILISLLTREGEYLYVYLSMRDISCLQMEYPML